MSVFRLPDLGEGLQEARLVAWHVRPGSLVRQGQDMVAVETAKAIVDIPAPEDLRLLHCLAQTDEAVRVGDPLFEYEASVEQTSASADHGSVVGVLQAADDTLTERRFLPGRDAFGDEERRLADARLASDRRRPLPATVETAFVAPLPRTGVRSQMAHALENAARQVVQVTVMDEARLPAKFPNARVLPWVIRALIIACRQHPLLNAHFANGELLPRTDMRLGLAVDTQNGLFVPVLTGLEDCDEAGIRAAIEHARLTLAEGRVTGGGPTISVSNFGALGGRYSTPLVMPPQVAILGIGRAYDGWRINPKGRSKPARWLPLSLSVDHRALTGGEAARFLQTLITLIRKPEKYGQCP